MQRSIRIKLYSMVMRFTRSKKTNQRMFAVDICVELIQHVRRQRSVTPSEYLDGMNDVVASIAARMEDKTPKLRARALRGLSDLYRSTESTVTEEDHVGMSTGADPLRAAIREMFVQRSSVTILLRRRVEDVSSSVRKETCRVLVIFGEELLRDARSGREMRRRRSAENEQQPTPCVRMLSRLCSKDPSPAVRSEAMLQLTSLVSMLQPSESGEEDEGGDEGGASMELDDDDVDDDEPSKRSRKKTKEEWRAERHVMRAWCTGVIPLVGDPEVSVQSKCLQSVSKVVLRPLLQVCGEEEEDHAHASSVAWRVLNSLPDDSIKCLQRAMDLALRSSMFTPNEVANAMQRWLRPSSQEENQVENQVENQKITLSVNRTAGAWVILEALFLSTSSGTTSSDEAVEMDSDLIRTHWERQLPTFTQLDEISSTNLGIGMRMLTVLRTCSDSLDVSVRSDIFSHIVHMLSEFQVQPTFIAPLVQVCQSLCITRQKRSEQHKWITPLLSKCGARLQDFVKSSLLKDDHKRRRSGGSTISSSQSSSGGEITSVRHNAAIIVVLCTIGEIALLEQREESGGGGDVGESMPLIQVPDHIVSVVQMLLAPELIDLSKKEDQGTTGDMGPPMAPAIAAAAASPATTPAAGTIIPSPIRAHAFTALGKFCLRSRDLTKEFVPLFARELQNQSTPISVRNNILIILGDLCTRFTSQLTQYIPNMAACLHDPEPVLRRHTLLLLTHLLSREYIRLRPGVFYRMAAVLADDLPEMREHAEYVLSDMFLVKHPKLFLNNFLSTVLVLTGFSDHEEYQTMEDQHLTDDMNHPDDDLNKFYTSNARDQRRRVYKTLLKSMSNEHKLELMSKMCKDVLCQIPHGSIPLNSTLSEPEALSRQEEAVRDVLWILGSKEIQVSAGLTGRSNALGRAEAAAADENDVVAAVQQAKGMVLSKLSQKHVLQIMVPELVRLKTELERMHSPLLENVMKYFTSLYTTGRQVKDIVTLAFPMIHTEIEYDLRQYSAKHSPPVVVAAPVAAPFSSPLPGVSAGMMEAASEEQSENNPPSKHDNVVMPAAVAGSMSGVPFKSSAAISPMPPPPPRFVSTPRRPVNSPGTPGRTLRHVLSQTPGLHALKRARVGDTPTRPRSANRPVARSAAKSWASGIQMSMEYK